MSMTLDWLLFDFGGCLDSDGVHSRTLFLKHFMKNNLIDEFSDFNAFHNAYSAADQFVIDHSLLINAKLQEMNEILCCLIARDLDIFKNSTAILKVATDITEEQDYYLKRNSPLLYDLEEQYRLGMISNFTGNLGVILKEYGLDSHFKFVLDSYHVGFSKPSPQIFSLAIDLAKTQAERICFIGDNPERDIVPARMLGMKTILISSEADLHIADFNISSLGQIQDVL